MRQSGRITAAIEILSDFESRRVPLKTAMADWGRHNRYAGAKDRAWMSGLCLDGLRRRTSLMDMMGEETPRAVILASLVFMWKLPLDELQDALIEEPHGAGGLTDAEREALSRPHDDIVWGYDVPDWVVPLLERTFPSGALKEASGLARRADVDLRINGLKATPEKAMQALKSVKAIKGDILNNSARIVAPDPSVKAPAVTIIPAFNKGWVEVQDRGSQIAAAAAGDIKSCQVLDFCAGGGGKTLALSAMMENTGQLYAYDINAHRLKPLYARAKRAGLRNLQVISPTDENPLEDSVGKMDVVYVDAPCSGAGTWRRHPDTKWRLTQQQLNTRLREQDKVLKSAARFVKPGGKLVYVTCSMLMEECEDRLDQFLTEHSHFSTINTVDMVEASGLLTPQGRSILTPCLTPQGALRMTPERIGTDGFFVSVLRAS